MRIYPIGSEHGAFRVLSAPTAGRYLDRPTYYYDCECISCGEKYRLSRQQLTASRNKYRERCQKCHKASRKPTARQVEAGGIPAMGLDFIRGRKYAAA